VKFAAIPFDDKDANIRCAYESHERNGYELCGQERTRAAADTAKIYSQHHFLLYDKTWLYFQFN
jgi:hypothetical protein